MNQDMPWTWLAMVVIAFISWIFNRIQEATAERQRAKELARRREKAAAEAARTDTGGPAGTPPAPPPLPERREARPVLDEAEVSLRELMEALGGPPVKPPPPQPAPTPAPETIRRPTAPPPRESRRETRPRRETVAQPKPPGAATPDLTEAERAALERIRRQSAAEPTPFPTTSVASPVPALTEWLRRPGALKQAVVLREILDKPVSLR